MKYVPLEEYSQSWIFRHKDLPVADADLRQIKPLDVTSAQQFWRQQISAEASHASHFLSDDWPERNGIWSDPVNWQASWDSDEDELPVEVIEHCQWDQNTVIFFCYDNERVIQTTWTVFTRCWKNFLFYDDEPLLIGKKRKEVLRFHSSGYVHLGRR